MLKQRKNDFALLIARKNECFDENNPDKLHAIVQECYVFSSENKPQTPLSRAFFNNMLNKTLLSFVNKRKMQTIYTTHSFRHDFITELWRDSNDIEFVRQFMGHKTIQSTVAYIQDLPESERLVKLLDIDRAKAKKAQQN
jgi:integrase